MMLERTAGAYVLRYDPMLIARFIEIKRREAGSFSLRRRVEGRVRR